MLRMRRHLGSKQEFTNWLTTMYLFYLVNRLVAFDAKVVGVADGDAVSRCRRVPAGPGGTAKSLDSAVLLGHLHSSQDFCSRSTSFSVTAAHRQPRASG